MAKPSPIFSLEEIPGDQFASIQAAQLAAFDDLVSDVLNTIRELIAAGRLVQVNGKIIPQREQVNP